MTGPYTATTRQRLARAARWGRQLLRIIPAILVVLAPFFLVQAPARVLTRRCEEPQTKRAGVLGLLVWLLGTASIAVGGGVI